MKAFYLRLALGGVRMVRRFLSNQPTNQYEQVVFTAVRSMAAIFGMKGATT